MASFVCMGAILSCSRGAAPSNLMVTPENKTMAKKPLANIMDYIPMKNIMPFGMCNSNANPTVVTATAAAYGVLTPMPCIPNVVAPWDPGCKSVNIGKNPALNSDSQAKCLWNGTIQINNPGINNINCP